MKKVNEFIKKYIPKTARAGLITGAFSALCLVLSICITPVADFLNSTVATAFRFIMSVLSQPFPFSLFELLICISPALLVLLGVFMYKKLKDKTSAVRFLFSALSLVSFIFSGFVFSLGIPYHITPIEERMGIGEEEVNSASLEYTARILRDEVNALAEELSLSEDSESYMNMSFSELSLEITEAYGKFSDAYGFPLNYYTRAKPIFFDGVMSSAHLLGIYTFFTGESNINDGYPDYNTPFTVAHEFAHQRGIVREDEANFTAFAVCIRSDNAYIRYSGYLNMYEYVISALYNTDTEAFKRVHSELSDCAFADIRASGEHSEKYSDSKFGEAVGNVNDAYLQINGTEGRISYSLAVRLAVAYYS